MKISDIITERKNASVNGNDTAKIARTAKQAAKAYKDADKGAIDHADPAAARKRARELYGVEIVDDFVDVLELPNSENDTDKQQSMFSKDNR